MVNVEDLCVVNKSIKNKKNYKKGLANYLDLILIFEILPISFLVWDEYL